MDIEPGICITNVIFYSMWRQVHFVCYIFDRQTIIQVPQHFLFSFAEFRIKLWLTDYAFILALASQRTFNALKHPLTIGLDVEYVIYLAEVTLNKATGYTEASFVYIRDFLILFIECGIGFRVESLYLFNQTSN